jgi:hypothetical protein
MPKTRKTKEEKIKSQYRLQNFKLAASERTEVKDANEFAYLSSEYVVKDLSRTFLFTLIVVGILITAKMWLK